MGEAARARCSTPSAELHSIPVRIRRVLLRGGHLDGDRIQRHHGDRPQRCSHRCAGGGPGVLHHRVFSASSLPTSGGEKRVDSIELGCARRRQGAARTRTALVEVLRCLDEHAPGCLGRSASVSHSDSWMSATSVHDDDGSLAVGGSPSCRAPQFVECGTKGTGERLDELTCIPEGADAVSSSDSFGTDKK